MYISIYVYIYICIYIGETAPNSLRGKLVSLKEAAIVLGIVAGYTTGAIFGSGDAAAWQPVYGCALPVSLLMLAGEHKNVIIFF
jgi:hypothetical protein